MVAAQAQLQQVRPPALERLGDAQVRATAGLDARSPLAETILYMLSTSGKQLRPGIVLEAARYGVSPRSELVQDAALALELAHVGSLAHDDIVDGGEVRRAWESVVERDGTCSAGVAASWLYARALELVTGLGDEAVRFFVRAMRELCDGQLMDAEDVFDVGRTPDRYRATIDGKTSSLFRLAASLGALAGMAPKPTVDAIRTYAHHLGLVFQMSDDILDVAGTEEALGKPPGADLRAGVYTLPVILALEVDPSLPPLLPQAATDEEVLAHVVETVGSSGAVARAFAVAERHAELARAALDAMDSPEPEAAARLHAVLAYALERARPEERP